MPDRVGRNDPCPCGSGKKYKRCCMARDKAAQAERVAWERAAHDMRVALIGFAKESDFVVDLARGLGQFWQDRYTIDTVHMMSVDESLRFFDWFSHDYTLRSTDSLYSGKRLIEAYRDQVSDALSDKEAAILDGWIESLPGSAFVLDEADPENGTIVIRDLLLPDRTVTVEDTAAASYGQVGQILLARPLPENRRLRLSGATVVLPASEEESLRTFIEAAYQAYLDESQSTTVDEGRPGLAVQRVIEEAGGVWAGVSAQFLRDRAYLLTHYALEWAEREGRPAVSAQDPEARKPGGESLRKLIRWGQERVQVR